MILFQKSNILKHILNAMDVTTLRGHYQSSDYGNLTLEMLGMNL